MAPGVMYFDSIYAAKKLADEIAKLTRKTMHYSVSQMKRLINPPKDHSFGNEFELKNDMAMLFIVHMQIRNC